MLNMKMCFGPVCAHDLNEFERRNSCRLSSLGQKEDLVFASLHTIYNNQV